MEKPLAQAAGTRLAGQAHQSGVARSTARGCSSARSSPRSICRPTLPSATIAAPAGPASTSARRRHFPAPYRLDARRCISYLTIEHKGPIPRELRPLIGNRIYGCDDCLAVCPWNKFAQAGHEAKLAARAALRAPPLAELARLDDAGFRALVRQKPGQAHRPRALFAQCADRDRQFRRRGARRRGRAVAGRCLAAGARRGGLGARPARPRAARTPRAERARGRDPIRR